MKVPATKLSVFRRNNVIDHDKPNFYLLVWIFIIGSLLGYYIESFYVSYRAGHFVSRSNLLFGPFNNMYGIGLVVLVLFLHQSRNKKIPFIVFESALIGAAFEYVGSVFMELAFGVRNWNYSSRMLNLHGCTTLTAAIAWGILGALFIKFAYTWFHQKSELWSGKIFKVITLVAGFLMLIDVMLSIVSVMMQVQRHHGVPATNFLQIFFENHFPNQPRARFVE